MSAAAVLGVIVIAGAAFLVLRSDSTKEAGPPLHAPTSVELQPGTLTVEAVGAPFEFPADVRDLVLSTLGAYVDHGIVNPLRTRAADEAELATVFDAAALTRLAGTDRALVLDEGFPKAVGDVSVTTPPVAMTALADGDGKLVLVSATVALSVDAQTKQGRLEILRSGSLVFAPDAAGVWKITGWTLSTERGGKALGPTTTTTTPAAGAVTP